MRASVPFRTAKLRPRTNVRVQRRFASSSPGGINTEEAQKKAQEALASAGKRLGQAVEVGKKYMGPVGEKAGNMLGCECCIGRFLVGPLVLHFSIRYHACLVHEQLLTRLYSLPGTSSLQLHCSARVPEAGLRRGAFATPNVAVRFSERVLCHLVACHQPRVLARACAIRRMGQGRRIRS